MNSKGTLYGTTYWGGASSGGTVYNLDTAGNETVLYSFVPTSGGVGYPPNGLVLDSRSNAYGTTDDGGDERCPLGGGCGIVFEVDTTGKETILHTFTGINGDGFWPTGLIRDTKGNIYGGMEWERSRLRGDIQARLKW